MSLEPENVAEHEDEALGGAAAGALGARLRELADRSEAEAEAEPERPTHPPMDPHTETCPTCDGFGETVTGSRLDAEFTRQCDDCRGKGWRLRPMEPSPLPTPVAAPEPTPEAAPEPAATSWGGGWSR